LNGKEYNGDMRMESVRRLRIWRYFSPIRYTFSDEMQLCTRAKRVFVIIPGDTIESLIWAFGLHGGQLDQRFSEKLTFVVPPIFMKIPLIRDFLLSCGAVTYDPNKDAPIEDLILELVNAGRSVCFCPSRFANVEEEEDLENNINAVGISDTLLTFARQERLELVPVVIHGERKRYFKLKWPRIQRYFLNLFDYAFPTLVLPRYWANQRPPLLRVMIGSSIHCEKWDNNTDLKRHFCDWVKKSAGRGDTQILIN